MSLDFRPFLDKLARSTSTVEAAVADNCRFEARASDQRWMQFRNCLPHDDVNVMTWEDWAEANNLHMAKRTNVSRPSIPDAFLTINRCAWKEGIAANQDIVRFENLILPLKGMWDDSSTLEGKLDNLHELLQRADSGKDYDAEQSVAAFFDLWNNRRDNRPSFAAFYDEIQDDCDDDDWPHALRDRLGLGHYGGHPDVLIPVAMMRYSLKEVFETQKGRMIPTACALPTVLDGGMHEYFFPVPTSYPFGATLHLDPPNAEVLTAEILHFRIEYQRRHLLKLGFITKPHRQHDNLLRESRDIHLLALRIETHQYDFGEELRGRT